MEVNAHWVTCEAKREGEKTSLKVWDSMANALDSLHHSSRVGVPVPELLGKRVQG